MLHIYHTNQTSTKVLSKKILFVDHDLDHKETILPKLLRAKHEVTWVPNGIIALEKFKNEYYDLVLINKQLPYKDAESLSISIANSKSNVPVFFLIDNDIYDGSKFISVKNFDTEFEAKTNNVSLQPVVSNEVKEMYQIGKYQLNTRLRLLSFNNEKPVKLSPKENKLLRIFIQNKGKLVTKEYLIKKVWYNDDAQNLKSIGVYITKMRKLLKKDPRIQIINEYKVGFILKVNE